MGSQVAELACCGVKRRLILDVDTGDDDAVAIMLAALHPDLDLLGCTTVWGNHDVETTTKNTLRVLDHIGRSDVGVYQGQSSPAAPHTDGPDTRAFRGSHTRHLSLSATSSTRRDAGAVEWLVETLRATSEPITLVGVAPQTNIATALAVDESIVAAVDEIVIMGGGHALSSVTPSAETNIWRDAAAAATVVRAGFERLVLVPLDATCQAVVTADQCRELSSLGTAAGSAAAALISNRIAGYQGSPLIPEPDTAPVHDALCVAHLVAPDVLGLHHLHVAVETTGTLTYGRTVIDVHRRGVEQPNAHVALSADAELFYQLLRATFGESDTHS